MKPAIALALLALAASAVTAEGPIELESSYSDNGGVAAKPMKACIGGEVTRVSATNPNLNVREIRVNLARESVTIQAPAFGGKWLACLEKRHKADALKRYDMTVQGISRLGQVIQTIVSKQLSFSKIYVLGGQSNGMMPVAASKPFAGDLLLTDPDAIYSQWLANDFYGVSLMMTTSVGAASFSSTPRNTFASVQVNWTRPDAPNFQSLLFNTFGWQFVTGCIEFARQNGPAHCIQVAVATTSIRAHMPNSTYAQSGMISSPPFTSAASEPLQSPGGLFYGTWMGLLSCQPRLVAFVQGEKDYATPAEYAVSLHNFYESLKAMFGATRDLIGYNKKDDADEETYTQYDDFTLHNYEGHSVTPPSQNPPFYTTAMAKRIMKGAPRVCTTSKYDLGFFTKREGGLHHPDTYYIAATRSANCYANRIGKGDYVINGPVIQRDGVLKSFDASTGRTSLELTFDQSVQWGLVPRPAAVESKAWTYSQFSDGQLSLGVAQNVVVTTAGPTLTLAFDVELPSHGPPTTLVYTILSDFQRSEIQALPSTVEPNPHWPHINPLPSDPFTVPLIRASDFVTTAAALPTAPFTLPQRVLMNSGGVDPEWADVVALQKIGTAAQ